MKKYIFSIITYCLVALPLFGGIKQPGPSIVFVHIGKEIPEYLETAIEQARLFNDAEIILVGNEGAIKARPSLAKHLTVCVSCESLHKSKEHEELIQTAKLDRDFREGFWFCAVERFFYLQDLINQHKLEHVIHLESDNMLYADVFTLCPIFQKHYPHLGITCDNNERCIPGFVYIAGAKSINHLAKFLVTQAKKGIPDMEAIGAYYKKYGEPHAKLLPIIMREYPESLGLKSAYGGKVKHRFSFCKHVDTFRAIFDAAAIGQFFGGIDPRNGPSRPGFINERCCFDPSRLKYTWRADNKGRQVPYATFRGCTCRINNLHIHSKQLDMFASK